MSNEEEGATAISSEQGSNTSTFTPIIDMDQVTTLLQNLIRSSQDEFRQELCAIKETINRNKCPEQASSSSASNRANIHRVIAPVLNAANVNTEQRPLNTSNIPLKEWKVYFDGNGSVSDFLFISDT